MSPEDFQRIDKHRRDAIQDAHGHGHITMGQCPCCGYLEFASRQPDAESSVTIRPMSRPTCQRCAEVAQRAPEIFEWVRSVILHHLMEEHPPSKTSGD